MQTNFNEFLCFRFQVYVKPSMISSVLLDLASKSHYFISLLGLYLAVVRELVYSCDPQRCAGGSHVLLSGVTIPDWSAVKGLTKRPLGPQGLGFCLGVRYHPVKIGKGYLNQAEMC